MINNSLLLDPNQRMQREKDVPSNYRKGLFKGDSGKTGDYFNDHLFE
jgi:hypothetical protein